MNDATDRLLDAALLHVPFEGMNDRALVAGARDIGISPDVARAMFPQGGAGLAAATVSIVVKTLVLYTIMVTGSIWEKEVFGRWLFARPFFWEDVVSILVLALHSAYLLVLVLGSLDARGQMVLALAAYAAYVVNATQFLLKLRAARRQPASPPDGAAFGLAR